MAEYNHNNMPSNKIIKELNSKTKSDCKFLFEISDGTIKIPSPYPKECHEKDLVYNYVMMPWSERDIINCFWGIKYKWNIVKRELHQIGSLKAIEKVIRNYNPNIAYEFNFGVLYEFIKERVWQRDISNLVQLTLRLPCIVTQPVPLLRRNENVTLFLSQQQISCLMANAFFCTFTGRNRGDAKLMNYPDINFISLFSMRHFGDNHIKVEKLKCIMNYFNRVLSNTPRGVVSFERRCLSKNKIPYWKESTKLLTKLSITNELIQDKKRMLKIDFANKYIGGGILDGGSVMEEILFSIYPELIISRLFTEKLSDNEVLIITGCERFNSVSGYGNSFKFNGNTVDDTKFDEYQRKQTTIVAMDALDFSRNPTMQFSSYYIERELNKCFCGFMKRDFNRNLPIASGLWGCGVFKGDYKLKTIIQLIAASECERELVLCKVKDDLAIEIRNFYSQMKLLNCNVSQLYNAIISYEQFKKQFNYQYDLFQHAIRFVKNLTPEISLCCML